MRKILLFTMILVVCGNLNAVILIDQNTRNGSFETGQWTPWVGSGNLINDASFASDGTYYLKLETTTGRTEVVGQGDFSINKEDGYVFTFQFDIRTGVKPFDRLLVSVGGRSYDGDIILGSPGSGCYIPTEAANGWVTITGTRTFSAADWQDLDVSTLGFGISLSKTNWISGELLQGFLDNIVLTQIPEPMTILLFGIGGLILRRKR